MSVYFCVLGSGSSGNAALVMTPHAQILIDIGFSPQDLEQRMSGTGASWESLDAVVITHLHGDHIKRTCFKFCARHNVEVYCHDDHARQLEEVGSFRKLKRLELVRAYSEAPFDVAGAVRFFPLKVPHDSAPTFGFRIEAPAANGQLRRLGYLADLGECDDALAREMYGVDLLALEFNHDEHLQRTSGRHPSLIQRIMSRDGHLSNRQAADVYRRVLESGHPEPKFLVQMHLSRECNRVELAYQAAQEVTLLAGAGTRVFCTRQEMRGTMHQIG